MTLLDQVEVGIVGAYDTDVPKLLIREREHDGQVSDLILVSGQQHEQPGYAHGTGDGLAELKYFILITILKINST